MTRADCIDGPRGCGFVSCRYHLLGDITVGGSFTVQLTDRKTLLRPDQLVTDSTLDELAELVPTLDHTCVLDVIDEFGALDVRGVATALRDSFGSVRSRLCRGLHRAAEAYRDDPR